MEGKNTKEKRNKENEEKDDTNDEQKKTLVRESKQEKNFGSLRKLLGTITKKVKSKEENEIKTTNKAPAKDARLIEEVEDWSESLKKLRHLVSVYEITVPTRGKQLVDEVNNILASKQFAFKFTFSLKGKAALDGRGSKAIRTKILRLVDERHQNEQLFSYESDDDEKDDNAKNFYDGDDVTRVKIWDNWLMRLLRYPEIELTRYSDNAYSEALWQSVAVNLIESALKCVKGHSFSRVQWTFTEMRKSFEKCITNSSSTIDLIGGFLDEQLPFSMLTESASNILPYIIFEWKQSKSHNKRKHQCIVTGTAMMEHRLVTILNNFQISESDAIKCAWCLPMVELSANMVFTYLLYYTNSTSLVVVNYLKPFDLLVPNDRVKFGEFISKVPAIGEHLLTLFGQCVLKASGEKRADFTRDKNSLMNKQDLLSSEEETNLLFKSEVGRQWTAHAPLFGLLKLLDGQSVNSKKYSFVQQKIKNSRNLVLVGKDIEGQLVVKKMHLNERELGLLVSLQGVDCIPPLIDYFVEKGYYVAVLPYLNECKPVTVAECNSCFLKLLEAVSTLHLYNVIHHDISPSNVRLSATGKVILLDFEFATFNDGQCKHSFDYHPGTEGFAALDSECSFALDAYSCGAVYFFWLQQILDNDDQTPLEEFALIVAKEIPEAAIAFELLSENPQNRSIETVLKEIKQLCN